MLLNTRFLVLLSLIAISVGIFGCETIEGAGRDIQSAGGAVEEAAE